MLLLLPLHNRHYSSPSPIRLSLMLLKHRVIHYNGRVYQVGEHIQLLTHSAHVLVLSTYQVRIYHIEVSILVLSPLQFQKVELMMDSARIKMYWLWSGCHYLLDINR